jgi:SAM-dependent methyltransferase
MATLTALDLGCGRRKADYQLAAYGPDGQPYACDWRVLRLDASPEVQPDLLCVLGRDRIDLPDDSVHVALAMHVLEHIGRQGETAEWFHFWQELYRVMVPGGRVQLECPLASSLWAWADPTHTRALNEYSFLYLNQDAYRCGGSIPDYRIQCDFVPVTEWARVPDAGNEDVRQKEAVSFLQGTLAARKPLKPWWEDVCAS